MSPYFDIVLFNVYEASLNKNIVTNKKLKCWLQFAVLKHIFSFLCTVSGMYPRFVQILWRYTVWDFVLYKNIDLICADRQRQTDTLTSSTHMVINDNHSHLHYCGLGVQLDVWYQN